MTAPRPYTASHDPKWVFRQLLKSYSTEIIKWLVGKTYEDKQVLLDETLDLIKGAALVTKVMTGVNEQLPFVVDLITAEPEVRYTFHHDMDGKIGNLKTFSVYSFFEHIEAGDTSSVRLFIENGMDVNAQNNDGNTALSFAKEQGHQEIIDLLEAAGATE